VEWLSISGKRPSIVGTYTTDLVYERLAPGIVAELEERNPKNERGKRRGKHHQWLTDDVHHPALAQHLHAVIGLMRASGNWDQFYRMMDRAFQEGVDNRNGGRRLNERGRQLRRSYSTGFMQRLFAIVGSIAVMPDVRSCSLRGQQESSTFAPSRDPL
jgi:hypothetical protein